MPEGISLGPGENGSLAVIGLFPIDLVDVLATEWAELGPVDTWLPIPAEVELDIASTAL